MLRLQAERFTTMGAMAKAAGVLLKEDLDCQVMVFIGPSDSFEDACRELSALNVGPERIEVIDFVSYGECRTRAEAALAKDHPDIAEFTLGPALVEFCITFATIVAWNCAAEATKRAKGIPSQ